MRTFTFTWGAIEVDVTVNGYMARAEVFGEFLAGMSDFDYESCGDCAVARMMAAALNQKYNLTCAYVHEGKHSMDG
jgi:hypothetical protein